METDLLDGKYGNLGINVIADWLGHSPKVMLQHYRRVNEDKFRQVTQRKSAQDRPQHGDGNVDGIKSYDFCKSPIETGSNPLEKLTGISTVHSPVSNGFNEQGVESPFYDGLTQPFEHTAFSCTDWQATEPCVIVENSYNGEDRIRTCGTHTSSRI